MRIIVPAAPGGIPASAGEPDTPPGPSRNKTSNRDVHGYYGHLIVGINHRHDEHSEQPKVVYETDKI